MTKHLRTVKASFVMGILLVSAITAVVPTSSAGLIFNLQSVITVTWSGNQTQEPVVPRGAIRQVDIDVSYQVTRGVFGRGILEFYKGQIAFTKLEVVESSEWCTATLMSDTIALSISSQLQTGKTILSLQVDENAPAFALGYIKIKASVGKLGLISGFEQTFDLTFVPSYKPLIDPELPETNTKEIGPLDSAVFPIEVENLGNARTIVYFDVVNVPEGWNAIITSQVTLDESKGSKSTAYLVIRPPKNFGYHNDEKTIKISMTPVRADDTSQQGTVIYETFLVQSRGFSTPGFEPILFIGALLVAFLILKRRQKK